MSQSRDISRFSRSLEEWIAMQKVMLENFKNIDARVRNSDRLDIIIHTRLVFNHMMRTLKAFDDWLQDPFISSNIPRELLLEVWSTSLELAEELLKLDVKHTSEVRNIIEKAAREGQLSPMLAQLKDLGSQRGEEKERRGPAISI
ncbi:MAG: DUF2153 domain-containing protein [Acidilobaceae archaeon]|nr:DUF2153 domain-containing protein [Acidilobaceae archaeon]MCX8165684.1 DUF2153 domain-containing protein [Acidilobaceae archaeon]MDW7974109.1 DUF2153 family protein [Sulfolobales archaeon]